MTIIHLDPKNNIIAGQSESAPYIVSLSGGLGSAFAAQRAIDRYGRENVALWFADTKAEDPDLYRFLHDLMDRWGGTLYWYTDGRTPQEVWDQKKLIPNSLIAPCTYELKVKPFRQFIAAMPKLPVVYIGFKSHEVRRQVNTTESYAAAMPDVQVEYPLLWEPVETRRLEDLCEPELGIELPLLYRLGYEYNNCSGVCCRSGKECWLRTLEHFPERYAEKERWEAEARSHGDARSVRSFYARKTKNDSKKVAVTLRELREEYQQKITQKEMVWQ